MPDTIMLAVDKLHKSKREEFFLALLTYAGPPPCGYGLLRANDSKAEAGYRDWCKVVEVGVQHMYPAWGEIDVLDATIQYRHWCRRRGTKQRRIEATNSLVNSILKKVRRTLL